MRKLECPVQHYLLDDLLLNLANTVMTCHLITIVILIDSIRVAV